MKKHIIPFVLTALVCLSGGFFVGMLVYSTQTASAETAIVASRSPEVCEVVAHKQFVHSVRGIIRIAIVRRSNGELRSIDLDNLKDKTSPSLISIPDDARYAYVLGLDVPGGQPFSVVPIFNQ